MSIVLVSIKRDYLVFNLYTHNLLILFFITIIRCLIILKIEITMVSKNQHTTKNVEKYIRKTYNNTVIDVDQYTIQ